MQIGGDSRLGFGTNAKKITYRAEYHSSHPAQAALMNKYAEKTYNAEQSETRIHFKDTTN